MKFQPEYWNEWTHSNTKLEQLCRRRLGIKRAVWCTSTSWPARGGRVLLLPSENSHLQSFRAHVQTLSLILSPLFFYFFTRIYPLWTLNLCMCKHEYSDYIYKFCVHQLIVSLCLGRNVSVELFLCLVWISLHSLGSFHPPITFPSPPPPPAAPHSAGRRRKGGGGLRDLTQWAAAPLLPLPAPRKRHGGSESAHKRAHPPGRKEAEDG